MRTKKAMRDKLLRRAETVLRPSLAILLECAYEGETNPAAAQYLEERIGHFNRCAERGTPLKNDLYEAFPIYLPASPENADMIAIGLLSQETLRREDIRESGLLPGEDGFEELAASGALSPDIGELAPIVLGVGVADSEEESRLLARLALFRSPDRHSPDKVTAECERRILARLNRHGPGAGGLGGGHTALAVSVEGTGRGYVTLLPGDCFTRYASVRLAG